MAEKESYYYTDNSMQNAKYNYSGNKVINSIYCILAGLL